MVLINELNTSEGIILFSCLTTSPAFFDNALLHEQRYKIFYNGCWRKYDKVTSLTPRFEALGLTLKNTVLDKSNFSQIPPGLNYGFPQKSNLGRKLSKSETTKNR